MKGLYIVAGVLAFLVFIYLLHALIRAERF
ncbi:MAG TPA: K(+)-transporting ATPase subunit F [Steroidobacteraceae bacterium]|jgi:K+-transporting ATPase KdpF subunit